MHLNNKTTAPSPEPATPDPPSWSPTEADLRRWTGALRKRCRTEQQRFVEDGLMDAITTMLEQGTPPTTPGLEERLLRVGQNRVIGFSRRSCNRGHEQFHEETYGGICGSRWTGSLNIVSRQEQIASLLENVSRLTQDEYVALLLRIHGSTLEHIASVIGSNHTGVRRLLKRTIWAIHEACPSFELELCDGPSRPSPSRPSKAPFKGHARWPHLI